MYGKQSQGRGGDTAKGEGGVVVVGGGGGGGGLQDTEGTLLFRAVGGSPCLQPTRSTLFPFRAVTVCREDELVGGC